MNRAETIATRMAEKLFAKRRGHGNSERIVERHLSFEETKAIVKTAYEIGWEDGLKEPKGGAPMTAPIDDFTKRVLTVTAPPIRDVHTHECDNCGANFSCSCSDPGEERADCGGCKREELG